MVKLGANTLSQNIQRNLGRVTSDLSKISERLSSGQRINRASDDAAGLAIAESLSATTRVLNQGIRNLNDGISLLNIADGALAALSDIMMRLTELSQQSANGTFSNKQRLALDKEAQSLAQEYNRIARTTTFNDRAVFNADFGDLRLTAGKDGSSQSLLSSGLGGGIGDGTLQGPQSLTTTGGALTGVIAADLNGDGHADIISTNSGASAEVRLNKGDGTFNTSQHYATGLTLIPWRVNAADMNGDGSLDLVTSDLNSAVSIMLNRGDGTFAAANTYSSGGTYNANGNQVEITDINNDNVLDVITSNGGSNLASIYLGGNNGTLSLHSTFNGVLGAIETITTSDYNNDGNADLSISYNNGIQETRLGDGTGAFTSAGSFNTGMLHPYRTTESGDFNNDGNADIALIAFSSSASIYLGRGDGTFGAQSTITTSGGSLIGITIADLNGDSFADLALRSADTELTVALNNGDGTFSAQASYSVPGNTLGGWGNAYDIGNADFNNDGAVDLVIANALDSTLSLLFGNSKDGVSALQRFSLRTQSGSREAITYFKKTLEVLSQQRGDIGVFQARAATSMSNLQSSSIANSMAKGRITDADIASESASYIATQILQQAATAILTQANQQPALALTLLGRG